MREDYGDSGDAWDYFSHDQARSRAYRIGLFDGPVVLAVAYTLLVDWVSHGTPSDEQGPPMAAMHEVRE